jgi:hypothetical protein
MRKFFSKIIN